MTVAAQLNAICDAQPFVTRFMVRNLLTGEEIGRGENEETPSGSTRKTSIMMAVLKAASEGRIDLDQPVTYEKRLAEEVASGMFRYMTPGIVISLRDAVAGMMVLLYYGQIDFYIGFLAGIKAFTAAVLGGIGSLPGAMLGGLLIGLIEVFWSAYFSVEYKDVAAFSILVLVLIFRPTGLLGRPDLEKV